MKIFVSALLVFVLFSCAGVPASVTSRTNVASTPAVSANENPVDTKFFQRAQDLLKDYAPPETDSQPLHDALAQGAIQLLQKLTNPKQGLEDQSGLDTLSSALDDLGISDLASPSLAVVHLRDSDSGSEDLVFFGFEQMMGLSPVVIHRQGSTYETISMDGPDLLRGVTGTNAHNFIAGAVSGDDVTGDAFGEMAFTYEIPGGSGKTTELHVLRWDLDAQKFKPIFQATLISWADEAIYEFDPTDKGQNIILTYPWLGVFDSKLAAHPTATQVWAYDAAQDQFVKQSETVESPKTVRQQLNVAEDLFRRGEFENAIEEFNRAWKDESLTEESTDRNLAIRAFARFREGQLFALLGRVAEAQAAFADVRKAGGNVAKLADTFSENYKGNDSVVRAWAALPGALDVDKVIYDGGGKADLDFSARGTDIFYKGEIVAAYLDAHPDVGAQIFTQLNALGLGFKATSSSVIDLDGDGKNEYLFVTQEGGASTNQSQHLWFVYRGKVHWLARDILQAQTLTLDRASIPLPSGKGNAVKIKLPANAQPSEQVLTWDRTRVIYLDPQKLQPRDNALPWPAVGGEQQDIE